jgi:hypothetical protein
LFLKKINIDRDYNIWNFIVINSPDFYTIAHNPSLIEFLSKTFGWKGGSYFIIDDDDIIGVYQHSFPSKNKIVSMPHFSYGGILRKEEKYSKKQIFDMINTNLPKSFEIRDFEPYTRFWDDSKIGAFIELEDSVEKQLAVYGANHRSKIKRSYNNGLKVINDITKKFVEDFYAIYSKNMLRLGSPALPKIFFLNLIDIYKFGEIKVFLAYKDDQVIGGAVILTYNDFVEDCWFSTLSKYNYLYVSYILYWEMIKYSIKNDKKVFSMGRCSKDSSLAFYKRHWKPIEKQLYFSYSKENKVNIKKMSFLTQLWKFLPETVANIIGPTIAGRIY